MLKTQLLYTLLVASLVATPAQAVAVEAQPVTIDFRALVNGADFICGKSYDGVGKPQSTITPTDLRFFVSDVALITASGETVPVALTQDGIWQYRDAALLDFEDGSGPCRQGGNAGLNKEVKGTVPPGEYVGLSFDLGLPFDLDHGDATMAPSPLNITSMFWAWATGYRFVKVDMTTAASMEMPDMHAGHDMKVMGAQEMGKMEMGAMDMSAMDMGGSHAGHDMAAMKQTGFALHFGSTGCKSASMRQPPTECSQPNVTKVTFAEFDPTHDKVAFDIGAALANSDLSHNEPGTDPGCMGDPNDADCKPIFAAFGLPFGTAPAPQQSVISIVQ